MSTARLALLALLAAPASAQIVFAPPQTHPVSHPLLVPLAGDLDLDGDVDVVAQGAFPGPFQSTQMSVMLASGDGALGPPAVYSLGLSGVGEGQIVDVADFDGPILSLPDGKPDVLVGGVGFGNQIGIGWMAGKGDGSFTNPITGPTGFGTNGAQVTDVVAVDVEGDGDLDFIGLDGGLSFFIPARIVTARNESNGAFSLLYSLPATIGGTFLAVADLDGDGRVEALCNSSSGGTVSVFAGTAAGFAAPVSVAVGGLPQELVGRDFDGDGAMDLLLANASTDALQLLKGDGLGALGAPTSFPAGHLPGRVVAGDLDGDGLLDALVSASGGEVSVMQGGPGGTLTRIATVSSPLGSLGLALADLDGDGELDATVARAGSSGAVDVLLNKTYSARSPFADLGHALAGTKGDPIQLAEGTLLAGQPFGFHLFNARANALATHVIGLSPLFAAYKGGTLVPAPNLLNALVTDGAGELHLTGPWPAGGSGLTLWLQFWIQDPAGVKGRAASNALSATIP
jgi:FG-GAP-like repeat